MPKQMPKKIADPLAGTEDGDDTQDAANKKAKMLKKAVGRGISFTKGKAADDQEDADDDDESSDGEFAPGEEPDSDEESEEGEDDSDEDDSDEEEDELARHEVTEEGEGSVSATAAT